MADSPALALEATPPGTYRQRGTTSLQRLFRTHFPEFCARYDSDYARRLGHSRLQRITRAVERFVDCGDYSKGIARIQCTNPDCRHEYFRPFSCNSPTCPLHKSPQSPLTVHLPTASVLKQTETFSVSCFLLELTQHVPPHGPQYIRRYGLYDKENRSTWARLIATGA